MFSTYKETATNTLDNSVLRQPWKMQSFMRLRAACIPARRLLSARPLFYRAFTHLADPETSLISSPEIKLRGYQEECIQSVLSYLGKGHKRLGISLATGSGKTVIFTQLIDRVKPHKEFSEQTLILVHRKELVEQAANHCLTAYPNKTVDIEMGNIHATGLADITVASIRSLLSKDRIEKFDPAKFKLVLVDEAHHIVARSYLEVLEYFGLAKPDDKSPALVGVSATFSRFDGLKLGTAIDHIVYHKDYVDMIGEKWLADAIFTTVCTHADLSNVGESKFGDFIINQLSKAVNTDKTNDLTVKAWSSRASMRKSTLVFCVDIDHVTCLTEKFRSYGIDARYITSQTPKATRTEELEAFRNQEYPVLLNCGLFTEGTDIPNIDCVVLARPTRSKNLLVQMIGRGLRLHPGKENCHIIDMVSALEQGVITTPTLFGLSPNELLNEASVDDIKEARMNTGAPRSRNYDISDEAMVDFTDYDSVHELIQDTSGDSHIRSVSRNAWVQVDEKRYVLSTAEGRLVISRGTDGLFSVFKTMVLPKHVKSKFRLGRTMEVASSLELTNAVHAADTLASSIFEGTNILTYEPWRRKPASPSQLELLKQLLKLESDAFEGVTKGQAADMITKLKHGAKGQFKDMSIAKRRTGRKKAKQSERETRETVKVGPLN